MQQYAVSVVIPVFNRKTLILRALHSVLKQSLPAHEVLVVDDGSTDGARDAILQNFPQVRYIRQNRLGVSAARNRGIRMATGNWIAFLDSDDAWAVEKLACQIEALKKQPEYLLCHTNEIWIRNGVRVNAMKKHEKKGGWIFQHGLPRCAISPSSVLVNKRFLEALGGFDEGLPVCEDYDLWLRICARSPVLYLDAPLTIKYGGHKDQLSRQYWGMDRFRVQALDRILTGGNLKKADDIAARRMLYQKSKILMKGAKKRQNASLFQYCQTILNRHPLPSETPADSSMP